MELHSQFQFVEPFLNASFYYNAAAIFLKETIT